MGGYGSGYAVWKDRKTTVEDCLRLSIDRLVRDGVLQRQWVSGSRAWTNRTTGQRIAAVGYQVEPILDDGLVFRLLYTRTIRGEKHEIDLPVYLTKTWPHFGGVRWWFTCPLIVNGVACSRRVAKLYLPSGTKYFGCRHCHDLTYTSCQESHKFDAFHELIGRQIGMSGKVVARVLKGLF